MLRAVIFDLDGVIIDSEPIHLLADKMTMRQCGIEVPEPELANLKGLSSYDTFILLSQKYSMTISYEEFLKYQLRFKERLFSEMSVGLVPGILELLNKLKSARIPIGIASASNLEFIQKILLDHEISGYFDAIASGEDVAHNKPAPDVYIRAACFLGVELDECLAIEDTATGLRAAKQVHMKCIGFRNPNSGDQDLSLADWIVTTIDEIEQLIRVTLLPTIKCKQDSF